MAAKLRIGLVGAGGVAGHHWQVLSREPDAVVVGVTDVDPVQLGARRSAWGITAYPELSAMLPHVDAVFVCTPPRHHREPTVLAAHAHVPVFCEKPMALDLADADQMLEACNQAGVILQIGTNFHFEPGYRALWKLYADGELGDLGTCWVRMMAMFPSAGWAERRRQGHWRMRPEDSGGRMFEQIHLINWLHWVGGPVRSVFGRALSVADDLPVDDLDLAVLNFQRGYGMAELAMTPTTVGEGSAGIIGTRGGAVLCGNALSRRRADGQPEDVPTPPVPSRQRHFLDCVRSGRQPETDGADGRMSLAATLAFMASARSGQVVSLESVKGSV